MRKTLKIGIFLAALLLFVGVMGLTAEAAEADVIVNDENRIIYVTNGASLDIYDVWADADVDNSSLWNQTNGKWLANYSIQINASASLRLNPTDGCTWLKLNSSNVSVNVSFIRVIGRLFINDTMITGWNFTVGCNNTNWSVFRPYIYIAPGIDTDDTHAVFLNSTLGYLGYDLDNRYGIVYEDIENLDPTGYMHNCTVLENFIGIDFQGTENMNVTDTWVNNSKDAGIVYTTGGATAAGSHGGYIGDNQDPGLWPAETYDGVTVIDTYGNGTADGIRLLSSDNMTLEDVDIINSTKEGLDVTTCNNITANNTLAHHNTNATTAYNIKLNAVTNSTFTNCTAHSPNGTVDGGNWYLYAATTYNNNFTSCLGYNSSALYDFYIDTGPHNNTFTSCIANNSNAGFWCLADRDNTFVDCVSHNHTLYDYKFWGSQYNNITNGYANDSAIGVYIFDDADWNTVTGLEVNRQSSYGIQIGTTGGVCHNNTIESVCVVGRDSGDGIYIFGNCTYNYAGNSSVTSCTHADADGMGMANYSNYNTFYNCNSSLNGNDGFQLKEYAHNNTIDNCTAYNNIRDGLDIEDNAYNNTISYCAFTHNQDDGIDITEANNNTITHATVDYNARGVHIRQTPINYFQYCNIKDNTVSGVNISLSGIAEFLECIVWNPSASQYDWIFFDNTTVDVYGDYILGTNRTVNNQSGVSTSYKGWVDHDSGDGDWNLDTYEMGVWANAAGDNISINLTYWQTNYRQWYGTASGLTSNIIRQYCGGLTAGAKYDLLVDHVKYATYTAQSGTVIGAAAGIVWFNYTSPSWSTRLFEIMPYSEEVPPGPGPGPAPDKNDITVYVLTNGDDPIEGAIVYIYEESVLVKSGITDEDALYETTLDDGTYKFVANADDYREERQTKTITADTTVVFRLTAVGICPAIFAGPFLGVSILGWIVTAILVFIGFLIAYLIDSKHLSKDYLVLILFPNVVLVILGLFCQPLLIVIGVACCVIQLLWAKEEKL